MLQSGGGSYAAPQKVKLPAINPSGFIGTLLAPKPTATNYYSAPTSTIPKPVSVTPKVAAPPAAPSVSAAQATAPPDIDYKSMLESDPFLAEQIRVINAQRAADEAWMSEQRRRALIQFGEIPDLSTTSGTLLGNYNADINDTTRQLAGESTRLGLSTTAGINKAFQDAQSQYLSSLAARGMLRSGALGQHLNETTLARDQSRYTAMQELTDYMISLYQNYLGQVSQGDAAAAAATKEALDRLIAQVSAQEAARKAAADKAAADAAAAAAAQHPQMPTQGQQTILDTMLGGLPLTPELQERARPAATEAQGILQDMGIGNFDPSAYMGGTESEQMLLDRMFGGQTASTTNIQTAQEVQDILLQAGIGDLDLSVDGTPTEQMISDLMFNGQTQATPQNITTAQQTQNLLQQYGIGGEPSYIDTSYKPWLDYNAPVYDPMTGYRTTQSAGAPYVEPPPDAYTAPPGPDYGPSGEAVQLAPQEVQALQEIQQQVDPGSSDWDLIQLMLMMGGGY